MPKTFDHRYRKLIIGGIEKGKQTHDLIYYTINQISSCMLKIYVKENINSELTGKKVKA